MKAPGKPRGKVQTAILAYLVERGPGGGTASLAAIGRSRSLLGVHYKDLITAVDALKAKGLVFHDGYSGPVSLRG